MVKRAIWAGTAVGALILSLTVTPVTADNTCVPNIPAANDCSGIFTAWGDAENADVVIDSGVDGQVFGGSSGSGNAINNRVTLNGGAVENGVYGGNGIDASTNLVVVRDGAVNQTIAGGIGLNSSAGNGILFSGGIANRDLIGGYGRLVRGNRIAVSGGVVERDVVGGENFSGTATCNTVSLRGMPTFGPTTTLYGGRCAHGDCLDVRSGNMLEVSGTMTVRAAVNFQHFNFIPTSGMAGSPMLTTAEAVVLTPAGGDLATVTLSEVTGADPLPVGHQLTLIGRVSTKVGEADFALNGRKFVPGVNDTIRRVPQYGSGRMVRTYDFRLAMTGGILGAEVLGKTGISPELSE